jgi:hypothetical protein
VSEGRFKRTGWRSQYDLLASDDESINLEPLTAEDWDAARKSLGSGSKSLLFGTSTKVLDSIANRFKEQAPTSGAPSQPDPEAGAPTGVAVTMFEADAGFGYSRIEPKGFFMRDGPRKYVLKFYHAEFAKLFSEAEDIEDFWRGLNEAVEHAAESFERKTEQSRRREPPTS